MKEHAVLIPTSVAVVGGVVTEPEGEARAAMILLPGAGGPGRAGVNAFWARTSREIAARGVVTLRFDYPHSGNGASAVAGGVDVKARAEAGEHADAAAMVEATAWFRERLGGLDVYAAGECHGARMALELPSYDPDVAGVFAVVPYLRERFVPLGVREAPGSDIEEEIQILDERVLAALRELLGGGAPAWVLIGEQEGDDPFRLQRRLGEAGRLLEVEVVPGEKLHPVASPTAQREVGSRLARRLARELDRRPATAGGTLPPGPEIPPTRQAARMAMRQLAFLGEARERYGEVFTVRLPDEAPLVMVGDPELAKEVFSAAEDPLSAAEGNRGMVPVLGPVLGEYSLFLLGGERHLRHRRLLLPPLQGRRLGRHAETMRATIEEHLESWPTREKVAVLPLLRALTRDVSIAAVFGPRGESWAEPMREVLSELRLPLNARSGVTREYRDATGRAEALVAEALATSREGRGYEEREDVLSLLLRAEAEQGAALSERELRDELLTLMMAGMETTATSLAWALERLARTPAALERAAAEAEEPGPYLEATIQETLRVRPVVPMAVRRVLRPFALGGHLIPAGAKISPNAFLLHFRPDVYPDPMSFRPERFLERPPGTYTWVPFGGGVRRCVGGSFALTEMRAVLSALLSRMTPRPVDPEAEAIRNRTIISLPAREAELVLEPRPAVSPAVRRAAAEVAR